MLKTIHFGQKHYALKTEVNQFTSEKGWKKEELGAQEPKTCQLSGKSYRVLEKKTRTLPLSFERVAKFCLGFFAAVLSLGCAWRFETVRQLLTGRQVALIVALPKADVAKVSTVAPIALQQPPSSLQFETRFGIINAGTTHTSDIEEINTQLPHLVETIKDIYSKTNLGHEFQILSSIEATESSDKAALLKAALHTHLPFGEWEITIQSLKNYAITIVNVKDREKLAKDADLQIMEDHLPQMLQAIQDNMVNGSATVTILLLQNSYNTVKDILLAKMQSAFPECRFRFKGNQCYVNNVSHALQSVQQNLPEILDLINTAINDKQKELSQGKKITIPLPMVNLTIANTVSPAQFAIIEALNAKIKETKPSLNIDMSYSSGANAITLQDKAAESQLFKAQEKAKNELLMQELDTKLPEVVNGIIQTLEAKKTEVLQGEAIEMDMTPFGISLRTTYAPVCEQFVDKIRALYPPPVWSISIEGVEHGGGNGSLLIRNTTKALEKAKTLWAKLEPQIHKALTQNAQIHMDVTGIDAEVMQGIWDNLNGSKWKAHSEHMGDCKLLIISNKK